MSRVRRLILFNCFLALASAPSAFLQNVQPGSASDRLAGEMARRNTALVADGYHLTQRWTFGPAKEKKTISLEFIVPESESNEHTLSFWAESSDGELVFRLAGPDGRLLAASSGSKIEVTTSFLAQAGKYEAEVDRPAGVSGAAVFGLKGAAVVQCQTGGRPVQEIAASPAKGFHWPYLLFLPKEVHSSHLLVVPNNSGFSTEDMDVLRASAYCEIQRQTDLADRLGTPLLVPLFPRPLLKKDNLYLHALTRAALETNVERYRRVDLQLLAMMDDARAALHAMHVEVESKVFLWGFSASGSFVNRFAMLHPDRVAAVACGSPGGWPIAPVEKVRGEKLTYPVGVADVAALVGKPVNIAGVRHVSWFFFLGDRDENDAVPYTDSFSKADKDLIFRLFGTTPVSRWKEAEQLYRSAGLHARFVLYPGAAHSVTDEMAKDVVLFFESAEAKGK